ncbi:MAG: diaminopropionate ammonia-lyase [Betaproteobacteria bacterium]|nr:diaminopropionate ammonia-lyase [Betaproteobacteria bacterium]
MNTPRHATQHFRSPRAGWVANRHVGGNLPDEHINPAGFARAAATIQQWPGYAPTPLRILQGQAKRLGLREVFFKDESGRFGLGSFKALGGAYAVYALLCDKLELQDGSLLWSDQNVRQAAKAITVCCATDGNHGRSVAWGAHLFGAACVIFVHATVSRARCEAIEAFGARVCRVEGNYDDSVREAQRHSDENHWFVVSDTSYDHYIDIPSKVMHGYGLMAQEICDQLLQPPTHVIVQTGVGALAASVCAYFWHHWGPRRPRFVLVEPMLADCFFQSIASGHPVAVAGPLQTIMAGLACGEVSPIAWQILRRGADDACVVCEDDVREAMRSLQRGEDEDPSVTSGETGAAGLALLQACKATPHLAQVLGLDAKARVLIIGSEGMTDPQIYQSIVEAAPTPRTDYLLEQIEALAQIGLQDDGACNRLALTDSDRLGRDWLIKAMESLKLVIQIDKIGNIFGIYEGMSPDLDPVMTGSHIDTVRTGGRYDGCLGVLAGLEVIRCMKEAGIKALRSLVVCAFTNEEGARFSPDMLGSLVFAQGMSLDEALRIQGIDGHVLGEELVRIGYAGNFMPGHIKPKAFIELHIEQGPVLERAGSQIGVVEAVQGISWQRLEIIGQSNHAGTTPMDMRRDAAYVAARITCELRSLCMQMGDSQRGTVGRIELKPNLINVIAREAILSVDLRNREEALLQKAEQSLAKAIEIIAQEESVEIRQSKLARFEPVQFEPSLIKKIEGHANARGYRHQRIVSGAGHDAQMLAGLCPSAMVFIPSIGGLSHNPAEHSQPEDIDAGLQLLYDVLLELCQTLD